jgi:hypothetical protein
LALFRKKPADAPEDGESESKFTPQPEKARKWFDHAKTAALSSNYEYALQCFANGIRLDPTAMSAHESMFEAAVRYRNKDGKPAGGRELKAIDDGTPIGRFAAAEFEWMKDLVNLKAALKLLDASVKAEQFEFGNWIAPRVSSLVRGQKKPTKNGLLQAMDLFRQVGAWNESMAVGEMARLLDPTDGDLDAQLKNLSAQRAMDQGGYDEAAKEEGGFRRFIRDASRQQELLEEESLAGGASIEERNLRRAEADYETNPTQPDAINRFAQLVKKRGTPEAEEQARAIYQKGFEDTGEYRFRLAAGDIAIDQLARRVHELDETLAANADLADVRAERDAVNRELLELKNAEYSERVAKYPTDRFRKYDLGTVQLALGQVEEAMAHFQAAKDEPKLRVRAGHLLGRCFIKEGWYGEAIEELKDTLQVIEVTEKDYELVVRYDLMVAMLAGAEQDRSIELARDAKAICSEIARKDITYRDIRAKRKQVDEVIRALESGAS